MRPLVIMPGAAGAAASVHARLLCAGLLAALAGCSDSVIRQYTKFGEWRGPADQSTILSGSPARDEAAYQASSQALSEADWKLLEKVAPRPIWERIIEARQKQQHQAAVSRSAATEPARPTPTSAPSRGRPDVEILSEADGNVRMLYHLRHYGGASVKSDRDSGTSRRKVTVKVPDLGPIVALLKQQLGGTGEVSALPSRNALAITCQAAAKQAVLDVLAGVDEPLRQVEITARIFEVGSDFDFQLGARALLQHMDSNETHSLASTFNTQQFLDFLAAQAAGSAADFQGGVLTLMRAWHAAGVSLNATFEAMVNTGQIKEVASPRMTIAAGETAYMLAGQELPIQSANITNNSFQATTTYKPVGVQLYVTPRAVGPDSVKLHVITVVSATSGFAPLPTLSGIQSAQLLINPIIDSREAETSVTVADGSTLVIGGLRMIRMITREDKVPGLGDVPVLEWLFKSHRSQKQATDLYFFVTPRLIE